MIGHSIAELVFWLSLGAIVYTYAGYPMLVWAAHKAMRRRVLPGHLEPTVSIIISAYNEAKHLAAKLENTLALDYPADRVEVLVGSDGSSDDTVIIAERYADRGVRCLSFPLNRGKTAVQNDCTRLARGDILVFMDAASLCNREALRALVAPFADRHVGVVGGRVVFGEGEGRLVERAQGIYWRYEQALKRWESKCGALVGVDGPLYAVRRELFPMIRPEMMSDFLVPLKVRQAGYWAVLAPQAIVFEEPTASPWHEFQTRRRLVLRGLRALEGNLDLLNPLRSGWLAWQIWSRKLLRWSAGMMFLAVTITALLLSHRGLYQAAATVCLLMVATALAAGWRDKWKTLPRLFAFPFYFVLVNWAAVAGWMDFLQGKQVVSWQPVRDT